MDEEIGTKSLRFQGWRPFKHTISKNMEHFICYANFGNFGVWPQNISHFLRLFLGPGLFLKLGCVFVYRDSSPISISFHFFKATTKWLVFFSGFPSGASILDYEMNSKEILELFPQARSKFMSCFLLM